jgi:hypothetical protein
MSNDLVVTAPPSLNSYDDCLRAAAALKKGDDKGVIAILSRAAEIGITDLEADFLVKTLAHTTGIGLRPIRASWKKLKDKADAARAKAAEEQRLRDAAAWAAKAQAARDAERDRLWASCSKIAESPNLLAGMEKIAHDLLGVVNEGAGVRGAYLTGVSRLLDSKAVRVLRTGASASGKNYPVEQTLKFFPEHAIVQISGTSPKSLPYEGGDDPDALKHKVAYIPEATVAVPKQGASNNEFCTMFRTLLSEGRLVYKTVMKDPASGRFVTETIVKNGPIAAILTTADPVDDQLETRCLIQDTDESGAQTEAIVERILSDVD